MTKQSNKKNNLETNTLSNNVSNNALLVSDESTICSVSEGDEDLKEKLDLKEDNIQFKESLSFHGNFSHTIDSKFRVNLPSDYRRILQLQGDASVVITNYVSEGSRCLEGFTLSSWMEFENKLRAKSRFDSKLQRLENFYLSRAFECQLDKSGRILIPEYLRNYAGITKEVTFTSSIHGFRIWNTTVWNYVFSEAEQALLNNPDLFAEIDI